MTANLLAFADDRRESTIRNVYDILGSLTR